MLLALAAGAAGAEANILRAAHDIQIELFPAEMKLVAQDDIAIKTEMTGSLIFRAAENLKLVKVEVNGSRRDVDFKNGRLRIVLESAEQTADLAVRIAYSGIFDDPAPVQPLNTDNPGYGVAGTISPRGTFLLAGAGWYPELVNSQATYRVTVKAPAGLIAVTAGRSAGHVTENGKTVSTWEVDYPVRGLALSAARYEVREKTVGNVTAATYLMPQNRQLADSYLNATAGYLTLYAELFGEYPFQKFAVVENFFPTGFGFPSYTLMGGTVLRLPFIVHTSLGHEIAHCWWGNGVYVDYAAGNWSEGLTSYVADYLYKEMKSEMAAREARRQWLKNYATLVGPQDDFALSRFTSRFNPVTKTIGYDKSAMVFHMIRQMIGEEAFWRSLRDLYRDRRFRQTSWSDIQQAFEVRSRRSLQEFFDQWVYRKGAPQFSVDVVSTKRTGQGWKITGNIIQNDAAYHFPLNLSLNTGGQTTETKIAVSGRVTGFELISSAAPRKLSADPRVDLFRKLYPSEIPPAVNSLKGSSAVKVVLSDPQDPVLKKIARTLSMSLGLPSVAIVAENEMKQKSWAEHDLLLVGRLQPDTLLKSLPPGVDIRPNSFSLNGTTYDQPTDAFFGVFENPFAADRVVAVFMPLSTDYAEIVAAKITHYGKYSYLAFQSGKNTAKGFWPVETSPLVYTWREKIE